MHHLQAIRNNKDYYLDNLQSRGNVFVDLDNLISMDDERKHYVSLIQHLQEQKNNLVKEIADLKFKGVSIPVEMIANSKNIEEKITKNKFYVEEINDKLHSILSGIPNLLSEDVPYGESEKDNLEILKSGIIRNFDFECQTHDVLGIKLGMMDFINAAKISGSRFVILKDDLALLERALADFMLDEHISRGFSEISPPLLVKDHAMYGVGQLPKFSEDSFSTQMNLRMIPTAEVPLANIVANCIVNEENLPMRFVARTCCFRSEAGSAGKDTKGMLRQHQFLKVELVTISSNDKSEEEFNHLLLSAENILCKLKLPYRRMLLCSSDTGFSSSITYDLEVWLPSVNKYREISSCSNCLDFQGRRMNAKYKTKKQKQFVHTMNGSGLAVGRTMIAILENYQNKDGTITIPEVLIPYMKGKTVICPKK